MVTLAKYRPGLAELGIGQECREDSGLTWRGPLDDLERVVDPFISWSLYPFP